MLVLFLKLFLVLAAPTAAVAGALAVEIRLASAIHNRRDRATTKRHRVLYVLFRLRQVATQPPALQEESLIALYNEGVLDVYPRGFATYRGLLLWYYRQLDRQGRQVTLWRPELRKASKRRLALSPNRLSAEASTATPV